VELQQEAWLRLNSQANHTKALMPSIMPKPLWRLADNEPYALVVDSKSSRLYVYKNIPNAAPVLVSDYYVTQGLQGIFKVKEGDNRTPIGAYFIDGAIKQALPDLYGYGALNIDYPNAWDKRLGRTGHGIWLHGTPSATYARAPYASNGCVVLANPDVEAIFQLPSSGAMPIVVVDKLEFVDASKLDSDRKSLLDSLEQWRKDWEALNIKNYGAHYSKVFKVDDYDRDRWLARKQEIFTQQAKATIALSNVAAIEYPSEAGMVITRFDQAYQANGNRSSVRKQLYWKKEPAGWKIVLENTL
jgi:murein L,D-transpeptidase YafK